MSEPDRIASEGNRAVERFALQLAAAVDRGIVTLEWANRLTHEMATAIGAYRCLLRLATELGVKALQDRIDTERKLESTGATRVPVNSN